MTTSQRSGLVGLLSLLLFFLGPAPGCSTCPGVSCPVGPVDAGRSADAGDGGPLLSDRWKVIRPPAAGEANLFGLFGDGPDRFYAAGSGGTILHAAPADPPEMDLDGRPRLSFTRVESGLNVGTDLTSISGTGPNDVYAVGLKGTILHFDGMSWKPEVPKKAMPMDPAFTLDLFGIFAYTDGALAVGQNGTWLKRVKGVWQPPQKLPVESLLGVWGTAANNIYAVGATGYVFRHDGNGWGAVSPGGFTNKLAGVFGSADNNVYAVGLTGSVLRNTGGGFFDYGAKIDPTCGTGPLPKVFFRRGVALDKGQAVLIGWEGAIVRITEQMPCGKKGPAPTAWDETGATDHRLEGILGQRAAGHTTIYIAGVEGIVLRGGD